MTDLNTVTVIGRITRDCNAENNSFGYLQNGSAVAKISIAVNRSKKNASGQYVDEASFFNVTIWGKLAESLRPRLLKGTQIAVEGFLKQDRWEKNGQNFSSVSIVANSVQLFNSKQSNQSADVSVENVDGQLESAFSDDIPF